MMFHNILGLSFCLFVTGMAYAQPDTLEQRRGVIPCALKEKLYSAFTSKDFSKWGKEEFGVLAELKAYKDTLDSPKLTRDTACVNTSPSENSQEVSKGDVRPSPAIHADSDKNGDLEKKVFSQIDNSTLDDRSVCASSLEDHKELSQVCPGDVKPSPTKLVYAFEDQDLEKKALLKIADRIADEVPILDSGDSSVVNTYIAPANSGLAQPAPIIIIIKQASTSVPSAPKSVAPLSFTPPTVKKVTPPSFSPRANALIRGMPRYTQRLQDDAENTVFVNILANLEDTSRRGPGSFSINTPTYKNFMDTKFAPKLPTFRGTTLSHATSNVPLDS